MSDKNRQEIQQLINLIQSGLVELFEQLRELRQRLDLVENDTESESIPSIEPLFSEVSKLSSFAKTNEEDTASIGADKDSAAIVEDTLPPTEPVTSAETTTKDTSHDNTTPVSDFVSPDEPQIEEHTPIAKARVARVLDPIAHELNTGEASAEVIAEYLQAAKDYLITKDSPNPKVARDIDVVLKFLRARGKRGIRPEERDNILKRLKRWHIYLSD
ncbi:MAG: hypothetical protein ACXADL_03695 [Candidatus Thorarchaeota archaeon]